MNHDTLLLGPTEAMQFPRALKHTMNQTWHANPWYGLVYLRKADLADGFYCAWLSVDAILKLVVIFPKYPHEEQMVALPFRLPMGWVESIPYFCAATETTADLANAIPVKQWLPLHPMEKIANTPPLLEEMSATLSQMTAFQSNSSCNKLVHNPLLTDHAVLHPLQKLVQSTNIYVDNFIMATQGNDVAHLQHLCHLLHSLDAVFRPIDAFDSEYCKPVLSKKKAPKGNTYLCTCKLILGWVLDLMAHTLELLPHHKEHLQQIFDDLCDKTWVGVLLWQKVLSELCSMAIGIPSSHGLFSMLQEGLKYTDKGQICITQEMCNQLSDFEYLKKDLDQQPTHLSELVPDHPVAVGPHNASGHGMGSVWLPAMTNSNLTPILWQSKFLATITDQLVTYDNPNGMITNSDLELASAIAHQDVLQQEGNCAGCTIVPFTDNMPTLAWQQKGSTSTSGPVAYLLHIASLHQRHYQYLTKPDFIKGNVNDMADDCSQLWHLTDSQLLAYFNHTYPQTLPWKLVTLQPAMHSALISTLQKQRLLPQSFLGKHTQKMVIGTFGKHSLPILWESIHTLQHSPHRSSFIFSKYLQHAYDMDTLHLAVTLSNLGKWKTTYRPLARRSPAWTTQILT